MPITLTHLATAEGGQNKKYVDLGVLTNDLVFATCSYYTGGNPTMSPSVVSTRLIGTLTIRTLNADVISRVYEALGNGTLRISINSTNTSNLDFAAASFRPSSPALNVNAYISTKVSGTRAWTDSLQVFDGEYLLCAQYASTSSADVRSVPIAADKGGTAAVSVAAYRLPEGATDVGNSFMEVIRVDTGGTFLYYGPNPTVMRVTVQGDPALSMIGGGFTLL